MRHGGGQMTPRLTWVHTACILPVHYPQGLCHSRLYSRTLAKTWLLLGATGLGLIWKHLRPHFLGVPCCHLSSPLSQWNRKQHGRLPPLRTQREIQVTKCPDWCRDPRHPAFQTGPKAGGSRPNTHRCFSIILLPDVLCLLDPRIEPKLKSWAHWFFCHRIKHFFQICCLWQKHFNTQEPNTETQKCFLTMYYICWEFETLFCISKAKKSYSKLFCCSTSSLKLSTLKTWPSLILERGVQDYPIITQQKMLYLNPVSTHLSLQPEHVAEGTGEHNHLGTRLPTNSSHAWRLPDPLAW